VVPLKDLDAARLWECTCATFKFATNPIFRKRHAHNAFFHNCKAAWQVHKCARELGKC
jgi:hypothetical protein